MSNPVKAKFKTYWDNGFDPHTDKRVIEFIELMMKAGKSEEEAWKQMSEIWNEAFYQGTCDESFNNSGGDQ